MVKENISTMGNEHTAWLSSLDFYKQELIILKERLTEIAGKYTSKDIAADVEHYENQIKVQMENIDQLRHNINENLEKSAKEAIANKAGYIDTELLIVHTRQKSVFDGVEKAINDLRNDFNLFATKWM